MLPLKYIDRIKELLGEDADNYLNSFDNKHYAGLRINTLKISREEFEEISPVNIESIPWTNKGFYYNTEDKPAKHPYYYAGLYYIQEPSAMAPATFLPIEEHDRVLDLCAAPGGKSTELAAKLNGTGVLVTNDISGSRAKALLKNIELSGVKNAIVTNEAPFSLAKHFTGFFDKILVDAPCSGEGMFRKDPAIIKNWEQYGVNYYSKLQQEIILFAADMLKPGGYLLYSTCTFSPEEDEGTLKYLLDNRKGFTVEKIDFDFGDSGHPEWISFIDKGANDNDGSENSGVSNCNSSDDCSSGFDYEGIANAKRLWPHKIKGEGHFVALLKKSEDAISEQPLVGCINNSKSELPKEFNEFLEHIDINFEQSRFIIAKDKIFYIPEGMYDIKGIKTLRNGLYMGEVKKNRFEPSQALACALKAGEFDNRVNFSSEDDNVIKYLKGETITLDDKYFDNKGNLIDHKSTADIYNGWCIVSVDGYSLGFAKYNNGTLKNKYLPGWRWM